MGIPALFWRKIIRVDDRAAGGCRATGRSVRRDRITAGAGPQSARPVRRPRCRGCCGAASGLPHRMFRAKRCVVGSRSRCPGRLGDRDMPDLVVSAANDYLLCSEAELRDAMGFGSSLELEPLFGVKLGRSHDYFPPSAFRGPFLPLLRHHPRRGVAFIFGVFNHSADWYAHRRVRSEYVEPPFEITLTFADGTSRTQWCNARLWNLYRGTGSRQCEASMIWSLRHFRSRLPDDRCEWWLSREGRTRQRTARRRALLLQPRTAIVAPALPGANCRTFLSRHSVLPLLISLFPPLDWRR